MAAAVGLAAIVALVYGGALEHEFVFDDWELVVGNDVVTWPLDRAADVIEHRPGGVSYRPVRMISYMVDHSIAGGVDARVFHASNLVWHVVASLLLYALAWRTLGSLPGALAAAALFAVHPLGSEAIVYVSGRRDLLSTAFVIAGLLAWWSVCDARSGLVRVVSLVLAIGAAAVALGAKENAAVFPALAVLAFVTHQRRGATSGLGSPAVWVGLALGVAALWLVVDRLYLDRVYEALDRLRQEPLAPQPALSLTVLGRYLWLAVWPLDLIADYRSPGWPLPTGLDGAAIASALALTALVVAGAWLVWRGRVAGLGLLWFPVALLPVAQIVPYREIVSEHNAYLALGGLALAAGDGVASLATRWPRAVAAAVVVVLCLLGVRAQARTADWVDDETLWTVTAERLPQSVRARHNLAAAWARRGSLERARDLLEETHADHPDEIEVIETLVTVQVRLGDGAAAVALAKRAAEREPSADRLAFLGWTELDAGAEASARRSFRRALREDWHHPEARRGLERIRERERQRRHLRRGLSR